MKTLVTGALQATEEELNKLRALGLEITLHPDERATVAQPEQYEAVICNGLFVYHDIAQFSNLRYIQLTSAGYDRVPMDYIRVHGIEIHNAAGVYSVPMAEWTIMRILELYKNAARIYENQAAHQWEKDRSWQELSGKIACIIGFGAYGQAVAERLRAFGVKVCIVNRRMHESMREYSCYDLGQLEQALSEADIVILAIALTPETRHLIDKRSLDVMKDDAVLINAARGALIDESALVKVLDAGKFRGVALDVFEQEPMSEDSKLWSCERVLLSSHNSFVGEKNHSRLIERITVNLTGWGTQQ